MARLYDTSILIDHLRGTAAARHLILSDPDVLHASEITRIEVLAGLRPAETAVTEAFLRLFTFHPVNRQAAELAGTFGRRYRPSRSGIDTPDLAIAATATCLGLDLVTRNIKHFPMFPGLASPY
ncbi:MAG: type II toxin-antitoxin system VapC family toxin [Bifidobacteriaceae bacterium]|jgi:predicted nucleic acid-binding protein|nr:type II toxin-antitoxin system VapC family toxin [Bifidobacteriaceae bacterium]